MSLRGTAILASIALVAAILVVFVTLLDDMTPASAQAIDDVRPIDLTQMEQEFAARETVYHLQVLDLETLLHERQATYDQQIETLTQALSVGHSQLTDMETQKVAAEQQLAQFSQAHDERRALLLARRQQTQSDYDIRFNQMSAQLAEVQAKLAEAEQIVGQ